MFRRIVLLVVDAHDDGDVGAFGGRGDDDFLRTGLDVLGCRVAVREEPRRLEHDVDAEVLPRELRRVAERQDLELVALDRDAVAARLDCRVQVPQDRVVLEQMRQRRGVRQVVDRDEVDVLVPKCRTHDVAADPAEAVDSNPHCHQSPPDKRFILQ